MILYLGVMDVAYEFDPKKYTAINNPARQPIRTRPMKPGSRARPVKFSPRSLVSHPTVTTGDVAEELEKQYGVMSAFFAHYGTSITSRVEDRMAEMMATVTKRSRTSATGSLLGLKLMRSIEGDFRRFLIEKEVEGLGISGVPTQRALRGETNRPGGNLGRRPSFIDTGLYLTSFRAWTGNP